VAASAVVAGAMALIGWSGERFSPTPMHPRIRRWYRRLDKPGFTPPGPVFGAGWGLIESALAWGGYRLLRRPSSPDRNLAIGLWAINNLLIAGWSGLFFGKRALGPSALAAGGMIAVAGGYCAVAARTDRTAAATALPLIAWLGFATLLAEEVWRRND
jgi:tryptophan-rich sensory protein